MSQWNMRDTNANASEEEDLYSEEEQQEVVQEDDDEVDELASMMESSFSGSQAGGDVPDFHDSALGLGAGNQNGSALALIFAEENLDLGITRGKLGKALLRYHLTPNLNAEWRGKLRGGLQIQDYENLFLYLIRNATGFDSPEFTKQFEPLANHTRQNLTKRWHKHAIFGSNRFAGPDLKTIISNARTTFFHEGLDVLTEADEEFEDLTVPPEAEEEFVYESSEDVYYSPESGSPRGGSPIRGFVQPTEEHKVDTSDRKEQEPGDINHLNLGARQQVRVDEQNLLVQNQADVRTEEQDQIRAEIIELIDEIDDQFYIEGIDPNLERLFRIFSFDQQYQITIDQTDDFIRELTKNINILSPKKQLETSINEYINLPLYDRNIKQLQIIHLLLQQLEDSLENPPPERPEIQLDLTYDSDDTDEEVKSPEAGGEQSILTENQIQSVYDSFNNNQRAKQFAGDALKEMRSLAKNKKNVIMDMVAVVKENRREYRHLEKQTQVEMDAFVRKHFAPILKRHAFEPKNIFAKTRFFGMIRFGSGIYETQEHVFGISSVGKSKFYKLIRPPRETSRENKRTFKSKEATKFSGSGTLYDRFVKGINALRFAPSVINPQNLPSPPKGPVIPKKKVTYHHGVVSPKAKKRRGRPKTGKRKPRSRNFTGPAALSRNRILPTHLRAQPLVYNTQKVPKDSRLRIHLENITKRSVWGMIDHNNDVDVFLQSYLYQAVIQQMMHTHGLDFFTAQTKEERFHVFEEFVGDLVLGNGEIFDKVTDNHKLIRWRGFQDGSYQNINMFSDLVDRELAENPTGTKKMESLIPIAHGQVRRRSRRQQERDTREVFLNAYNRYRHPRPPISLQQLEQTQTGFMAQIQRDAFQNKKAVKKYARQAKRKRKRQDTDDIEIETGKTTKNRATIIFEHFKDVHRVRNQNFVKYAEAKNQFINQIVPMVTGKIMTDIEFIKSDIGNLHFEDRVHLDIRKRVRSWWHDLRESIHDDPDLDMKLYKQMFPGRQIQMAPALEPASPMNFLLTDKQRAAHKATIKKAKDYREATRRMSPAFKNKLRQQASSIRQFQEALERASPTTTPTPTPKKSLPQKMVFVDTARQQAKQLNIKALGKIKLYTPNKKLKVLTQRDLTMTVPTFGLLAMSNPVIQSAPPRIFGGVHQTQPIGYQPIGRIGEARVEDEKFDEDQAFIDFINENRQDGSIMTHLPTPRTSRSYRSARTGDSMRVQYQQPIPERTIVRLNELRRKMGDKAELFTDESMIGFNKRVWEKKLFRQAPIRFEPGQHKDLGSWIQTKFSKKHRQIIVTIQRKYTSYQLDKLIYMLETSCPLFKFLKIEANRRKKFELIPGLSDWMELREFIVNLMKDLNRIMLRISW
jgi:hypothetical protein